MSDHVYKTIQIVGSSKVGVEDAIRNAVDKTSKSVHNLRWFKVIEVRGDISADVVQYWQVTVEMGFTLE